MAERCCCISHMGAVVRLRDEIRETIFKHWVTRYMMRTRLITFFVESKVVGPRELGEEMDG